MYDKNGYSRAEGIPIFKDVFDFYDVIEDFYLNEIKDKSKDLSELGKYLDYNFNENAYQSVDFLHYLHFIYEPYFNKDLTDYRVSWIKEFNRAYRYEIANYIKNWIDGKVKIMGKNSLDEIAKDSVISEMYATISTEVTPTLSAIEEIAITAPLPVSKIGRPKSQNVIKRKEMLFKEFLRLTETRSDYEAKQILLTTFKKYFTKSPETNRRNLDRTIREMKGQ